MSSDLADRLENLLNELHQSVLTQKKDAIAAFEEYYFRTKPQMNDAEIKVRCESRSECIKLIENSA
jgi:Holliday junction resolvasome RuvABC endonuclease subunit